MVTLLAKVLSTRHTYVYIYTYMHMYTHIYTHVYIHICLYMYTYKLCILLYQNMYVL